MCDTQGNGGTLEEDPFDGEVGDGPQFRAQERDVVAVVCHVSSTSRENSNSTP